MKTNIKGLQVFKAQITPNCRKVNGTDGAFKLACGMAFQKYMKTAEAKANKDADFYLCVTVDREKDEG